MISSHNLHIFDIDDTLVNTKATYIFAYQQIFLRITSFSKTKNDILLNSLLLVYGSSNHKQIINTLAKLANKDINLIELDKYNKLFLDLFWSELKLYPNAKEYLQLLLKNKKQLAICSNGDSVTQREKLKKLNLTEFFSKNNIYISGDFSYKQAKPNPDMLKILLSKNNQHSTNSCYYGNCLSDYFASKEANIDFVLINKLSEHLFNDTSLNFNIIRTISEWKELL